LRVLSDGTFYRVGGSQPIKVDVRIVAATHQPLEDRVRQGKFREDLFHRLNVIRLRLPPLRERREDISELANYFLQQSAASLGVAVKQLSTDALAQLRQFDFPGNVRQLENFCHWLTVMAPGQLIKRSDLPPEVLEITGADTHAVGQLVSQAAPANMPAMPASAQGWHELLLKEATARLRAGEPEVWSALTREFEKAVLHAALNVCRGRRVEAASRLGMGRNTITRKLRELSMDDDLSTEIF
jgi:two-component system, NtrC family, nitrogen regulation response regulator GlnG